MPLTAPRSLAGHAKPLSAVAISADGKFIFSGDADGVVIAFDLPDAKAAKPSLQFPGQAGPVTALSLRADGKLLAAGSNEGVVKFWDPADASDRLQLSGHTGAIHEISFHPKLPLLATAGADGTIRLWRLPVASQALEGHAKPVRSVAATADGKLMATGAADGSIRLWNAAGELLRTLTVKPQVKQPKVKPDPKAKPKPKGKVADGNDGSIAIAAVAFSADGALLAARLGLAHAVADHLAAAELHLFAVNGAVFLDLDEQFGVRQAHPVADRGAEHGGVGLAVYFISHEVINPMGPVSGR